MKRTGAPTGMPPAKIMLPFFSSMERIVRTTLVSAPLGVMLSGNRSAEPGSSDAWSPR